MIKYDYTEIRKEIIAMKANDILYPILETINKLFI